MSNIIQAFVNGVKNLYFESYSCQLLEVVYT